MALKPGREIRRRSRLSDTQFAYLLVIPLVIFTLALVGYPMAQSLWISFNTYDVSGTIATFYGLQNYADALSDPDVIHSTVVSIQFAFVVVLGTILIGLGVALLLNEELPGRGLARVLVLLPWAIPEFTVGIIYTYVYSDVLGTLNGALYSLGLIEHYMTFLTRDRAVYVLGLTFVWHYFPLATFFFLGALQTIPEDLYRQAKIDGAGVAKRFRAVTLRFLRYPLLIVLVLASVEALRVFDLIFIVTNGGPGAATRTLSYLVYRETFRTLQFGYGATISWLLVLLTVGVTLIYFVALSRWR